MENFLLTWRANMEKTHTIVWQVQGHNGVYYSPNKFTEERANELCSIANEHFKEAIHIPIPIADVPHPEEYDDSPEQESR